MCEHYCSLIWFGLPLSTSRILKSVNLQQCLIHFWIKANTDFKNMPKAVIRHLTLWFWFGYFRSAGSKPWPVCGIQHLGKKAFPIALTVLHCCLLFCQPIFSESCARQQLLLLPVSQQALCPAGWLKLLSESICYQYNRQQCGTVSIHNREDFFYMV